MFTLATLESSRVVKLWERSDGQEGGRAFYYVAGWRNAVEQLARSQQQGTARQPTPGAKVFALVEQYARHVPRAFLIRPKGEAMEPPFERMDAPDSVVVAMRTRDTRTFGFFARPNVYIAGSFAMTDDLKLPNGRADRRKYATHIKKVKEFLRITKLDEADIDRDTDVEQLVIDTLT